MSSRNRKENPQHGNPVDKHLNVSQSAITPIEADGKSQDDGTSNNPTALTPFDQKNLDELEKKLQLLRDRVAAVAGEYQTGLFVFGPGGISKSYTVLKELDRLQANFFLSNSRLTGRGLFDLLGKYPDAVHVIEDAEQLFYDANAVGVLRSALWAQRPHSDRGPAERWITWTTYGDSLQYLFTGGVIIICNRDLPDRPELRALKTRVDCVHLQPTNNELRALMRFIASKGFEQNGRTMDASQCRIVCEFVVADTMKLQRPLDLRLLVKSLADYLQWQENDAGVHWKDQVAARIRERPTIFLNEVSVESRVQRHERELAIARKIRESTDDRNTRRQMWIDQTGKSEQTLYRRLEELKHCDSQFPS